MEPRHARFVWLTDGRRLPPPAALADWLAALAPDPDAVPIALVDARAGDDPRAGAETRFEALAVVAGGLDPGGLAATMRYGADDLIDLADGDARWHHRLARLVDLASMRREAGRRRATAAAFRHRAQGTPPAVNERPPVLFVGAAGGDQLRVVDALSSWTVPAYAETAAHARRHLERGLYTAVVLSDLADAATLEATLAPLVAVEGPSAPTFVVVRTRASTYGAETAHHFGAHEVLEPNLPVDLVQRRLVRAVHEAALRVELRDQHAFAGALDAVTGRLEHGAFHAHVEALLRAGVHPRAALVAVRLDGLDEINREAGFAAGDRALAAAGRGLARCVRASDVVGRVDGAGFALWVEPLGDDGLATLAARVEERVGRDTGGDAGPPLHARIGWARPEAGDDAITLARRARDAARRTLLRAAG
ncbi:MAG: diguanylate cyclase [Alphaproteobacteria bacterium]|jgi:GGDEF domain-containing protein|nr:diguanylate cyclase [Alphaproteobacteria bacterium]